MCVREMGGDMGVWGKEVPRTRGTFTAKTGKVLDKQGQVGHPREATYTGKLSCTKRYARFFPRT